MENSTPKIIPAWLVWTLVTVASWGIWSVLCKLIPETTITPAQGQAISTIGIVPILAALYALGDSPAQGNRRLGILFALGSGIVSCLGNIAYFDVLNRGPKAAAVIPLTALYPAVTVLLAVPLLKERVGALQWLGIAASLVAIYFFSGSVEGSLNSAWLPFVLGPVVLWGVCGLMQKVATNHISARLSAIWFLLSFLPVGLITLVVEPLPSNVPIFIWGAAAAIGFTLALGNLTILLAFESGGKASIISPLCGLYPLVGIPLAIGLLGESLGSREIFGIIMSLVAVAMLSYPSQPANPKTAGAASEHVQ